MQTSSTSVPAPYLALACLGLPWWLKQYRIRLQSGKPGVGIPGSGRSPGGGHGNPLQYSCLENPHGQRNLVGYSPWDHKELDMSEQLIFTFYRSPNRLSFWRKLMPVV